MEPAPAGASQPKSLSVPVNLPPPFEATASSINALATGAGAALKTSRSDARTLAIRLAVANAIVTASAKGPVTSITLKGDASIAETKILCGPRKTYIASSVYLSYLNTLVQNINTISVRAADPTDIPSALKLLLATTNYSIVDKVKIDNPTLSKLETAAETRCNNDLNKYATDFYGRTLPVVAAAQQGGAANNQQLVGAGDGSSVNTFAFLGPIGTLVDTFLSILQPILIDWAKLADEMRRQQAIMYALSDKHIQANINTTGSELAQVIDSFSDKSRHALVGAFVEQLASIREMAIDLKDDCKDLKANQSAAGLPDVTFVRCFGTAWSKIQKAVADLNTTGNNYDLLADANTTSAKALFNDLMKQWMVINQGMANGGAAFYTQAFLSDLTEFITLVQAIAGAASKTNISALDKAAAAVK